MIANKLQPYSIVIYEAFLIQVKDKHLRYVEYCQRKKEKQMEQQNDAEKAKIEAKKARIEAREQIGRDLKILKAGIASAEESITTGKNEIVALMSKKPINKEKVMSSQAKIGMGLKWKGELSIEEELLNQKKKQLLADN